VHKHIWVFALRNPVS